MISLVHSIKSSSCKWIHSQVWSPTFSLSLSLSLSHTHTHTHTTTTTTPHLYFRDTPGSLANNSGHFVITRIHSHQHTHSQYNPFHATFNTEFLSCCHYSGSQHRAARGSCVEEDRLRFHCSQHQLSQSVGRGPCHGAVTRGARMRSAWLSAEAESSFVHWAALCSRVLKVAWNRLYNNWWNRGMRAPLNFSFFLQH